MTLINVTLPYSLIKEINDYSHVINEFLKHEISFNILKFSLGSSGVTLRLDVPEEKINEITESLKKNNILINKKGRISIDKDSCIECGACVSLCPTDALTLDDNEQLVYNDEKCLGCLLCIDACPRYIIKED